MSVLLLFSFALIVPGAEPTGDAVPASEDPGSWVKLVNARRLPTATEFEIALEMAESDRQRFAAQRTSRQPELPALTSAAWAVTARLDSALELYKELHPSFRPPGTFQDGKARLALFAAVQDFERLAALQREEQPFASASSVQRIRDNLEFAEEGGSLVSLQLQLAGMRGADRTRRADILQQSEELRKRRHWLAQNLDESIAGRKLDAIPTIRAVSEQLVSEAQSLVDAAWPLLGGVDAWATSKHVAQIDDIMAQIDDLLNTLRAEVDQDRSAEPSKAELRSLLIRKVALLRGSTLGLDIERQLGLEASPDTEFVKLQRDLLQVELELCDTSEERQRVCSHHIRLATELAKLAEAAWQSGQLSSSQLTEFRVHLLDAKILLLREQRLSERSSTDANK